MTSTPYPPRAGHPARTPGVPRPAPHLRFLGVDPTGTVRVEIDGAVTDPRVGLGRDWRSVLTPGRLGPAVLQAFTAAATARLTSWATDVSRSGPADPVAPPGGGGWLPRTRTARRDRPPGREEVDALRRAWRDLREFGLQLTELHTATRTASSPGRQVTVTVRGGQIVAVDLDPTWRRVAPDADLEHHLTHALRAARSLIAALPQRALEGCPDLLAVLADSPVPLPFPVTR